MSKSRTSSNRKRLMRLVTGDIFPSWLKFLWLRIPDVCIGLVFFFSWRRYLQVYKVAPSPYSLVVGAIATLGWIIIYVGARYQSALSHTVSPLWKAYWILIVAGLSVGISVRQELAEGVLGTQGLSVDYLAVIACLVGASFAAIASMLRSRANLLRLGGFLLVQALLVFSFSQPYLYGYFVDPARTSEDSSLELSEAISESREETVHFLLSLPPEKLPSAVSYLRGNLPNLPEWFFQTPPLTLLVSGLCERANFGSALYLSIITWTSVGFGDLVPTEETRAVAAIESILGYLFMAALAAVLIRWMQKPANETGKEYQ